MVQFLPPYSILLFYTTKIVYKCFLSSKTLNSRLRTVLEEDISMGKRKVTVSIDEELFKWIEEQIKEKRFAGISHAIEYALFKLMKEEQSQQQK